MLKIILAVVISALVAGCATEARISEYQMCAAQGREKFPVNSVPQNYTEIEYFQRQEGMTCTRIPSGFYNAGGMECEPNMRTYQRQVQKTRYVDANAGSRNSWIEQCANQQCIRKFGNSDCEKEEKKNFEKIEKKTYKNLLSHRGKRTFSMRSPEELKKLTDMEICACSIEDEYYKPNQKIYNEIKRRKINCENL